MHENLLDTSLQSNAWKPAWYFTSVKCMKTSLIFHSFKCIKACLTPYMNQTENGSILHFKQMFSEPARLNNHLPEKANCIPSPPISTPTPPLPTPHLPNHSISDMHRPDIKVHILAKYKKMKKIIVTCKCLYLWTLLWQSTFLCP